MSEFDESERRLRARIGGLSLHVRHDSNEIAANARAGLEARFVREALEIDSTLRGKALEKKIELIKSLHYTRLALKSATSRRKRKGKVELAEEVED